MFVTFFLVPRLNKIGFFFSLAGRPPAATLVQDGRRVLHACAQAEGKAGVGDGTSHGAGADATATATATARAQGQAACHGEHCRGELTSASALLPRSSGRPFRARKLQVP